MNPKHKFILAASCVLAAAVACLYIGGQPRVGKTGSPYAPATPAGATKPAQEQVVNNAPSQRSENKGTDRFFACVDKWRFPLDLEQKTVFERINTARARLVIQTQMHTDARVEANRTQGSAPPTSCSGPILAADHCVRLA